MAEQHGRVLGVLGSFRRVEGLGWRGGGGSRFDSNRTVPVRFGFCVEN